MNQNFRFAVSLPAVLFMSPLGYAQLARSADPFLGVSGGGNDFPGPALPFGMIKPGPDMVAVGNALIGEGSIRSGGTRPPLWLSAIPVVPLQA
jgi:putative alpha-1,2-mannosidase